MSELEDIAKLQKEWQRMFKNKCMTKKAIIDLVKPFRDKYNLTDKQALQIARNELSLDKIVAIIKGSDKE